MSQKSNLFSLVTSVPLSQMTSPPSPQLSSQISQRLPYSSFNQKDNAKEFVNSSTITDLHSNVKMYINYSDYSSSFFNKVETILDTTDLDDAQKILFNSRYVNKLQRIQKFKIFYACAFYLNRFLSTTLSVAIPALLSIQYYFNSSNGSVDNPIYWTAWALSIVGGFVTGYTNIFKVDQRYFLLRAIYQKLKNECWCFILLTKKYDRTIPRTNIKLTHKELFKKFMDSIENVIDDYMKKDMETVMQDNNKEGKEDLKKILNEVFVDNNNNFPVAKVNNNSNNNNLQTSANTSQNPTSSASPLNYTALEQERRILENSWKELELEKSNYDNDRRVKIQEDIDILHTQIELKKDHIKDIDYMIMQLNKQNPVDYDSLNECYKKLDTLKKDLSQLYDKLNYYV